MKNDVLNLALFFLGGGLWMIIAGGKGWGTGIFFIISYKAPRVYLR